MGILEQNLVTRSYCPLMDISFGAMETCAIRTLKAAILAAFHGSPLGLTQVRELFVSFWDKDWLLSNREIPTTGPYWEGPKAASKIAHKIYTLLLYYKVLKPIESYELVIDMYTIKGEYALLKKRSKQGEVSILVPHPGPFFRMEQPNLIGLLRFWHVSTTLPMYKNVSVMHVPLFRGRNSWQTPANLPTVLTYIQGAVSLYSRGIMYPSVGSHCDSCKSRKCMEVFNGGSHDHPWQRQIAEIRNRRKQ